MSGQTGHAMPATPPWPAAPSSGRRARRSDQYSRFVAVLKGLLPVIGMALLALVAVWPRLVPFLDSVRLGFPVIDLREAHELRMLNPRYAGVDRFNRPYIVTSAVGRQAPNREDLMSLERPRAQMTMHNGALVVVTAATAMYQSQAQLLDLFGDVNLVHENGTRFVTNTAHVDVAADTAVGNDPVAGHGPSGDITAQGFRVVDQGNTIVFTGRSHLLLKGTKPSPGSAAVPPSLPPEISETAAAVEAAAALHEVIGPEPASVVDPPTRWPPPATAAGPEPVGRPHSTAKREAPSKGPPSPGKTKADAG
ncbi:MAG: LPS export ABC transporter periplasmic protein LptC [Alphaproteobacteria bacterium]|nr:LPS export ABC transporter periplasmic protein LptC [Alphaproteobacteria bacterium]